MLTSIPEDSKHLNQSQGFTGWDELGLAHNEKHLPLIVNDCHLEEVLFLNQLFKFLFN